MKKIYLVVACLVTMAATAQQKGKVFSPAAVEAEILKLEPSADYARFDALFKQLDSNLTKVAKDQGWQAYFDMALVKYLETLKAKILPEYVTQYKNWILAYKTAMAAQSMKPNSQTDSLIQLLDLLRGRNTTSVSDDTPGSRLVSIIANTSGEAKAAELQKFLADPANAQEKWALQVARFLLS